MEIETINELYVTYDLYTHRFKNLPIFLANLSIQFFIADFFQQYYQMKCCLKFLLTFADVIFRGLSLYVSQHHNTIPRFKFSYRTTHSQKLTHLCFRCLKTLPTPLTTFPLLRYLHQIILFSLFYWEIFSNKMQT